MARHEGDVDAVVRPLPRAGDLEAESPLLLGPHYGLCAVLCLIGVLLEARFDQPITLGTVLAGFRDPHLAAPRLPAAEARTTEQGKDQG